MIFKIKTTKNTGDCLKTLRKNLRFPANILSRIAIAMSLKSESLNKDEIYKYYETYDSEGHEFSRYILFGEYEIVYKFHKSKKSSWKIYDVNILGVSLIKTYRVQFANALKDGTYTALLNKLQ